MVLEDRYQMKIKERPIVTIIHRRNLWWTGHILRRNCKLYDASRGNCGSPTVLEEE